MTTLYDKTDKHISKHMLKLMMLPIKSPFLHNYQKQPYNDNCEGRYEELVCIASDKKRHRNVESIMEDGMTHFKCLQKIFGKLNEDGSVSLNVDAFGYPLTHFKLHIHDIHNIININPLIINETEKIDVISYLHKIGCSWDEFCYDGAWKNGYYKLFK